MTRHNESQLGVDLGTTHTVAALTAADGRSQPLLFDASFLLPSSVYAEVDGHLLVGKDAERSARLDPSRYEPNPKRRIDDGTVLLGSREYAVSDLLAALLRRTADEASRVLGIMPVRTVLTYPANWATHRRSVLADAASRAGMPSPILVPEPIAAAAYFTTVLGRSIAPGGHLVVYDFGGGTFDTTVLRRRPDGGWDVLASDGLPDVGGVDLDAAIVGHVGQSLTLTDGDKWRQLMEPADETGRRRSLLLREDVRQAKEQLSRTSSAGIHVPLFDLDVHLTRSEFEQLSRSYLERTVDLTVGTLQRAGVRPDQIGGLFLVGGSSRIPMVSTLLHQRLGIAPTLIEQPELVVALGSVLAAMPPRPPFPPGPPAPMPPRPPGFGAPIVAPVSGMAPPVPVSGVGGPVSGPPAPMSAPVGGPSPISPAAGPVSAPPGSVPPVSGGGTAMFPAPATAGFGAPPPPGGPAAFGVPGAPMPPPGVVTPRPTSGGSGGKLALVLGAVVVLVLLLGVGGVAAWRAVSNDDTDKAGNNSAAGNRGNTGGNTGDTGGTGAAPANTKNAQPGADKQTVDVNKTVWYGPYKLTFGKVNYNFGDEDHKLFTDVRVENLGEKDQTPYVNIVLSVGGQQFDGSFRENTTVAAGQKSDYTVDFSIYDKLKGTVGSGELIIGDGDEAQAKIPLSGTGTVVAYEPVNVLKDKKVTVRDISVTFASCDIRGGFFDYNGQAKKGYRTVTCKVDIQYTGGSSHYVGSDNFRLGQPDGTELGPTVAPNEALYSSKVAPGTDLGFQIKQDAPGTYKLRLVDVHDKTRTAADVAEVDLVIK
ncbi:Hsp70 family protein [Dactylosporangium sp. AC04546]|uniref:Hsp70 family protein n=1 Tax=Dactylosporangium sp. AC04546 TaxID=2862460 RepID=UPI0027E079B4|nr:Hsp70 family protein [Dactylosporangium sp. AC04546]WVK84871.1 Hsp70 family protein [Dactylosporangium sp. AC04546]